MGLTRPALLLLLLLALLIAPAAAADDMIYWEEPCDSLSEWYKQFGYTWSVSAEFSHGESPYGVGHTWTYKKPESWLTRYIPMPPKDSGVQPLYLDFFVRLNKGYYSYAHILINGETIANSRVEWDITEYSNQWIYVHYPVSGFSGEIPLEIDFNPSDEYGAEIMIDTIRLITSPVVPDFTATPTGGDPPLTVKFTDTTKWSDSIISWQWDFGDGAISTERNPSHTYIYDGHAYDVALMVTTKWNESRMTVKHAFVTTGTVAEGDYIVDFTGTPTQGESPLEVTFNATVSPAETNITKWQWAFGDGATGFGETTTHTYNTYGGEAKYDVTLIGYSTGTGKVNETTKASYITVNGTTGGGAGATSLSTVKLRLIVMDYVGQRFENVTVTATPLESTGPWAWLEDLLGVPGKVDVQNEVLTGTTGTDGGIVFALVESVKYRIDITDPARGISTSITLYPKEDEVPVYIWPATTPPLSAAVNYALTATPLDDDSTELRLTYGDGLKNTTSVRFYVTTETGELVHSETRSHESNVTLIYAMDNDPGAAYLFGFEARHGTYGIITQDQFIRFTDDRPRVDFADWIPLWVYNWAAIAFIVSIAAIFGFQTLKFGVVIVPIFGLLFTYMGWLDTPVLLTLCAMTLGILLYLRYSEGETGT